MSWRHPIRTVRNRGSLRSLSRWLFLAVLGVAPWFYGGTTAWAIEFTTGMLGLVLVIWIASLLVDRRWPLVPRGLAVLVGLVLIHGWWMVINARAVYDDAFRFFVPVAPLLSSVAGSADYVLSFAFMLRVTALAGAILLVAEMAQRSRWLVRLWYSIAVSGSSIALLGIVQKASGAKMVFWQPPVWPPIGTFFGTFVYHGNAGAFLNLALPAIVGLTCWLIARNAHPVARALLAGTTVIVAVAIFSNTSRVAQAIGAALIIVLVATTARPFILRTWRLEGRTFFVVVAVVGIALFAVAQAARLDEPLGRWQQFSKHLQIDERWVANRAALSAIGDAGTLGFGPGVFRAIFPHYQQALANELHGTWRFLHDDYLQTLLEWGWLGSALLAGLFFGGLGIAIRSYLKADDWSTRQRFMLFGCILGVAGVAIHAAVDFPLQILSIQLLVATYLGVCWGSSRWERSEVGGRRSEVGTDSQ
ncbi:MAG: hypothetical protein QOH01_2545 [Verrucomicrobiota bacterium]